MSDDPARAAIRLSLQQAADQAEAAERAFRRKSEQRIAALQRARAFAFRRMNLINAMAAVAPEGELPVRVEARLKAAFGHMQWIDQSLDQLKPSEVEVKDKIEPVARAVDAALRQAGTTADILAAMDAFEQWYRGRFDCEFLDVFEKRAEFAPLVDF